MTNRISPCRFLCLPLAIVLFWQGSSCHSSNSNMSNNSARSDNVKASANTNSTSNARQSPADIKGVWGGLHISMEVTESGAEINYDCAHGRITEKIVPGRDGKFIVKGTHVKEHPGPLRSDEDQSGQPATYRGSIDGDTMTLTVSLSGDDAVGTFTLTRGKTGRVRRCA
jgi:hypothetical protein